MLKETTADIVQRYASEPTSRFLSGDLHAHRERLLREAEHLCTQAEDEKRELTIKEQRRCDELTAEVRAAKAKIDEIAAAIEAQRAEATEHIRRQDAAGGGGNTASAWRDADGNPIAVLRPTERLSARYASRAQSAGGNTTRPSVGEAIRGLITGRWPAGVDVRALTTGTDSAGGYLVDSELSARIIDLARSQSVLVRAGAQTVPMNTTELHMIRVEGDPSVAWTAENQTIAESQPSFARLSLRSRKLAALVKISSELVEDATNAGAAIEAALSARMALAIDLAGLLGSGAGEQPIGIFAHDDVIEQNAGSVDFDDFLTALQAVEDANGVAGAILYPPAVKIRLAKLKDTQNNYMMPPAALADLSKFTTTQLANDTAALGDFSQVIFGVRADTRMELSREAGDAYERDQVWIRVRFRGDVVIAHPQHIVRLIGIS